MRDLGLFVIILIIEASLHKRTTFQQAIVFKRSTIFNQIATVSYSCSARICATEIKIVRRDVLFERPIVQLFPRSRLIFQSMYLFSFLSSLDVNILRESMRAIMMGRHLDSYHKSTVGVYVQLLCTR